MEPATDLDRIARHCYLDRPQVDYIKAHFSSTVGFSGAIRRLIDAYMSEPEKFDLQRFDAMKGPEDVGV